MTTNPLDLIEARIADCRTYKFGMYNADKLAHEDAPAMTKALRAVEALHKPNPDDDSKTGQVCSHCIEAISYDSWAVEWPCPTIKAIEETR